MLTFGLRSSLALLCFLAFKYALVDSVTFGGNTPSLFISGETYNLSYAPVNDNITYFDLRGGPFEDTALFLSEELTKGWFEWTVEPEISPRDDYILALTQVVSQNAETAKKSITIIGSDTTSTSHLTSTRTSTQTLSSTSVTPTVVSIRSVPARTATTNVLPTSTSISVASFQAEAPPKKGLSTGAKAGIGIGSVLGAALLGVGAFFLAMRLRRKHQKVPSEDFQYPELVQTRQ